ncbi:hypothetical protein MMC18_007883 [Xylographa bjoerkii]|nr:hypothetical protein [Xylographa bjoerkii]
MQNIKNYDTTPEVDNHGGPVAGPSTSAGMVTNRFRQEHIANEEKLNAIARKEALEELLHQKRIYDQKKWASSAVHATSAGRDSLCFAEAQTATRHSLSTLAPLDPKMCPGYTETVDGYGQEPNKLDTVAVLSAGVPTTLLIQTQPPDSVGSDDHEQAKANWRFMLHIAALKAHRRLVFGMLGGGNSCVPLEWWEGIVVAVESFQPDNMHKIVSEEWDGQWFGYSLWAWSYAHHQYNKYYRIPALPDVNSYHQHAVELGVEGIGGQSELSKRNDHQARLAKGRIAQEWGSQDLEAAKSTAQLQNVAVFMFVTGKSMPRLRVDGFEAAIVGLL